MPLPPIPDESGYGVVRCPHCRALGQQSIFGPHGGWKQGFCHECNKVFQFEHNYGRPTGRTKKE